MGNTGKAGSTKKKGRSDDLLMSTYFRNTQLFLFIFFFSKTQNSGSTTQVPWQKDEEDNEELVIYRKPAVLHV